MDSLAQLQILNVAITILILKSIGGQNLIILAIIQSNKITKISSSSRINFLCIYLADDHLHGTTLSSHRLVCLVHALNDGKSILTNRLAFSQLRNIQLKGASIDTIIFFATLRSIITCVKFHRFSIQCCTGSFRTLINIKVKLHAIGCSTTNNRQNLGQVNFSLTINRHKHLRIVFASRALIASINFIASRRKRCSCADGEHHGGSQNAREEFLQFHCYSSLVRNSSYSCAAAQTPRFTGRMPAASSGLRGITNCVAAVV